MDYRKLNAVTKFDAYPIPRIDEMLNAIGNAKYISTRFSERVLADTDGQTRLREDCLQQPFRITLVHCDAFWPKWGTRIFSTNDGPNLKRT